MASEWLGPQPGRTKPSELGGNNWGNDAALAELEAWLKGRKKGGADRRVHGRPGHVALRQAPPPRVLALVGIYPVCSLAAMSQGSFADGIAQAYK